MKHYNTDQLDQYLHGKTGFVFNMACKTHIAKCDECRQKLEELKEDDILLKHVRNAVETAGEASKGESFARLSTILGNSRKESSAT